MNFSFKMLPAVIFSAFSLGIDLACAFGYTCTFQQGISLAIISACLLVASTIWGFVQIERN